MTRLELTELWLRYAARHTDRKDIFLAGIGLIHDGDNADYYSRNGLDCLFRAAQSEVDGPDQQAIWTCGIIPQRY